MRISHRLFILGGLLVALGLAGLLSPFATGSPDGLNKVAADLGFGDEAKDHALAESPVAGYAVKGVEDGRLSKSASGVIGVVVTFAAGMLIAKALRTRPTRPPAPPPEG